MGVGGGFVSSGFSENNCLWGLLSLAGSQNLAQVDLILYLPEADYCYLPIKRPFPSCLKPLFQREAKCGAIDMKISFYSYAMKLIITRKVWNLASLWNCMGFLELRNCLFHCHFITSSFTLQQRPHGFRKSKIRWRVGEEVNNCVTTNIITTKDCKGRQKNMPKNVRDLKRPDQRKWKVDI